MQPIAVIEGPINAEDLVRVPGTPWVLTSGMTGPTAVHGRLYAIDVRDHSCAEVAPYGARVEHDTATYGDEHGPLDPQHFEPHGIDVGHDAAGRLCLFVVHHGVRESIEVFRIDSGDSLALTWIGAVVVPPGVWGNDVARVEGGGVVVTSTTDISEGLEIGFGRSLAGEPTGKVVEWVPGRGWHDVAGTVMNSTNGVAVSSDGGHVYIGGWRPCSLVRVQRGTPVPQVDEVATGIMTDNVTWGADGRLLLAGAADTTVEEFSTRFFGPEPTCRFPTRIIAVDPTSLETEVIAAYGPATFAVGTTAIDVDGELWVGTMRGQGVLRLGR